MIREVIGDDVEIELRPPEAGASAAESAHYAITPYQFRPKLPRKLVSSYYLDLGQGLVDCVQEIYELEPRLEA
jgi:UDP-glucose 4-epimerase